jgi:hypothetical protein
LSFNVPIHIAVFPLSRLATQIQQQSVVTQLQQKVQGFRVAALKKAKKSRVGESRRIGRFQLSRSTEYHWNSFRFRKRKKAGLPVER